MEWSTSGIVTVSHLKEHPHPGGEVNDLSAHQAELLAVVQHRVQVLDPGRINLTDKKRVKIKVELSCWENQPGRRAQSTSSPLLLQSPYP